MQGSTKNSIVIGLGVKSPEWDVETEATLQLSNRRLRLIRSLGGNTAESCLKVLATAVVLSRGILEATALPGPQGEGYIRVLDGNEEVFVTIPSEEEDCQHLLHDIKLAAFNGMPLEMTLIHLMRLGTDMPHIMTIGDENHRCNAAVCRLASAIGNNLILPG